MCYTKSNPYYNIVSRVIKLFRQWLRQSIYGY